MAYNEMVGWRKTNK